MLHHAWLRMATSTLLLGSFLDMEADSLLQLSQLRSGVVTDDFHSLHCWSRGPLQSPPQCCNPYLLCASSGRAGWCLPEPFCWGTRAGAAVGRHLERAVHACLPLGTSLFSSCKASGDAYGSYNSGVTHGYSGESGAALRPPPLNAAIFGNTWRLGERIHVRN